MPQLKVALRRIEGSRTRPPDLAFEAILTNPADREALVRLTDVRAPSLVFQVETMEGEPVRLGPPPVPHREEHDDPIAPGATTTIRYRGFLDRRLPPGRYRIRYFATHPHLGGERDDPLESPWLDFEIREAIPDTPDAGFAWGSWIDRFLDWIWEVIDRICKALFKRSCRPLCRRTRRGAANELRYEKIDLGRDPTCDGGAWGLAECDKRDGEYEWRAAFDLSIRERTCEAIVKVRISWKVDPDAKDEPVIADIAKLITDSWDAKYRLCHDGDCCTKEGYLIRVVVEFLDDEPEEAHHDVVFGNKTVDMHFWSTGGNSVDHEFGHMLGPLDEYCTVNSVAHCAPYLGSNIMNGSGKACVASHFDLVRRLAESVLGGTCTVVPAADSCADSEIG